MDVRWPLRYAWSFTSQNVLALASLIMEEAIRVSDSNRRVRFDMKIVARE